MIVGISAGERRSVVEPFLKQRSLTYPVVLESENDLPRPYRVALLPTYIVIDREGAITGAVEGDNGFAGLSRLLAKAGLETDEPPPPRQRGP